MSCEKCEKEKLELEQIKIYLKLSPKEIQMLNNKQHLENTFQLWLGVLFGIAIGMLLMLAMVIVIGY
jgi:hypothetical protein